MNTPPAGDNTPTVSFRRLPGVRPSPHDRRPPAAHPDGMAVLAAIREALQQMRDTQPIASLTMGDLAAIADKVAHNEQFVMAVTSALATALGPIPTAEEIADAVVGAYARRWATSAPPPVDR